MSGDGTGERDLEAGGAHDALTQTHVERQDQPSHAERPQHAFFLEIVEFLLVQAGRGTKRN